MKEIKKNLCLIPLYAWSAVFIILPLAIVIYYAFTSDTGSGVALSLENFANFFTEPEFFEAILQSFKVAVISTVVCIFCGYPVAYILARSKSRAKFIIIVLMLLPMWMNFLIRTYSWLVLLEKTGLINTFLSLFGIEPIIFLKSEFGVIIVSVYDYLPFMVMPIYITLLKLDQSHLDAAADLGANPFLVFMKVTLPFSLPGILSGISMVFVPSVTTFVISKIMSSGNVTLIGDIIEKKFRSDLVSSWHFGSAISVVIMVIVLAFMYFVNRGDDDNMAGNGGKLLR